MEAILHEHTRAIATVEGDLEQLSAAVGDLKGTNAAIMGKLDKLAHDLAKAPHVPSLRDIVTNIMGVVVVLGGLAGLLMWWNAAMFAQYAKPIESALSVIELKEKYELQALRERVSFMESAIQFKPSFRDFAGPQR